jgi:predicted AAA+ superfamily ATPase
MNTIETFYDTNYQLKTNPRREQIDYKYIQVISPSQCGKTYFILDYLNNNFKPNSYLYIDCSDMRVSKIILKDLIEFIDTNSIEILALDNYDKYDFDIDFTKLDIENIIISTNLRLDIKLFHSIYLTPLDFEQFLLFANHSDSKVAFNYFFKYGNFPASAHLEENKQIQYLQNSIKINSKDDTQIYIRELIYSFIAQKRSLLELFQKAKENIKISKDRFYSFVKYLQDSREIYLVPNYFKPKAVKKIFSYNPALFGAVSFAKKFANILGNYIFLELYYRYSGIYYLDDIDFYIPSEELFILCMPFVTDDLIAKKSSVILETISHHNLSINQIQIITNATEQTIFIDDIECEIVPFYSWALSF